MTEKEAINELLRLKEYYIEDKRFSDNEMFHYNADETLCKFLKDIGYAEFANVFRDARKHFWYA